MSDKIRSSFLDLNFENIQYPDTSNTDKLKENASQEKIFLNLDFDKMREPFQSKKINITSEIIEYEIKR